MIQSEDRCESGANSSSRILSLYVGNKCTYTHGCNSRIDRTATEGNMLLVEQRFLKDSSSHVPIESSTEPSKRARQSIRQKSRVPRSRNASLDKFSASFYYSDIDDKIIIVKGLIGHRSKFIWERACAFGPFLIVARA